MSVKKFVLRTAFKIIIFACLMIFLTLLVQLPVINNEIALGQMENSNATYILMETYHKLRPVIDIIGVGITVLFAGTIACDTYKFIKIFTNKNEKEKN